MFVLFHFAFLGLFFLGACSAPTNANNTSTLSDTSDTHPRLFILTDVTNEPDDSESLVRLLLHSDLYSIEGIVATTSFWLNDTVAPEAILDTIDAYENVTTNLNAHTEGRFPSADEVRSKVKSSHPVYGLAALNNRTLSSGAELLISAVENSTEPLYLSIWGGAQCLAEALNHVKRTSSAKTLAEFTSRLHVYSISDQDNAGPWIRRNFPEITYIASIHGFNQYEVATWAGISAPGFDAGGPDMAIVSDEYIKTHFQLGILGAKYPNVANTMEGDSPSLLYVIPNGLNVPSHPEFGGWGGRYTILDISGNSQHYADAVDSNVRGVSGNTYTSNHATIWRWRPAFQNEMSARVQWSLSANYSSAVHPPKVSVNGTNGTAPWSLSVQPEQSILLDASSSMDPDTNSSSSLTFEWMHYSDLYSPYQWDRQYVMTKLNFTCFDQACSKVQTQIPLESSACTNVGCQSYHVILSVTNQGDTPMTRYRRVILNVENEGKRKRVRDEI